MILSVRFSEVETLNIRTIGGAIPGAYELNFRVSPSARTAVRLVLKGGESAPWQEQLVIPPKAVHRRQSYGHHVLVCKQQIQVPFGDSVDVPSIDVYIYLYAACQVPTLLGVTRSRLSQRDPYFASHIP